VAEWVDLLDPAERELHDALPRQIHERALELLLTPTRHDDEPRPRLEGHEHYVFGVFLVPIAVREEDRVYYQEIDVVATREKVVSVRKTPERGTPFDIGPARASVATEHDTRAGVIVYRIVDLIAEDFLDLVDALDEEIDELEGGIEHPSGGSVPTVDGHYTPALVMIIRGTVATDTRIRMTRYTVANALSARPLVC
jgi:Mg2+ and Co2+ transporter CorA